MTQVHGLAGVRVGDGTVRVDTRPSLSRRRQAPAVVVAMAALRAQHGDRYVLGKVTSTDEKATVWQYVPARTA